MARLKIKDAPLLTSIIGDEKIPTGGKGDFTLTPSMLLSFVETRLPFATNAQLESVRQTLDTKINTVKTELETSIDSLDVRVTNNETSVLGVVQDLTLHKADKSNPHAVTKQQVGLSNVDNTSDINKPVSTATQNALNLKFDKQEAQDKIYKNGAALPYDSNITYNEGAVVVKDGELQQKSDTDWKPFNKNVKASDVKLDNGSTQADFNLIQFQKTYHVLDFGMKMNGSDETSKLNEIISNLDNCRLIIGGGNLRVSKTALYASDFPNNDQPCIPILDKTNFVIEIQNNCTISVNEHGQGIFEFMRCKGSWIVNNGRIKGSENFPPLDGTSGRGEKGISTEGYGTSGFWGYYKNNSYDTSGSTSGGFGGTFPQWGGGTAATWGKWNGGFIGMQAFGVLIHNACVMCGVTGSGEIFGFNGAGVQVGFNGDYFPTVLNYPDSIACIVKYANIHNNYSMNISYIACVGFLAESNTVYKAGHPDAKITDKTIDPAYGITAIGSINSIAKNCTVKNNIVYDCPRKGIDVHAGDNILIRGNHVKNCNIGGIFAAWSSDDIPVKNISIIGNLVEECGFISRDNIVNSAGAIFAQTRANSQENNVIISDNIVKNCFGYYALITARVGLNNKICNNIIAGQHPLHAENNWTYSGIEVGGSSSSLAANNSEVIGNNVALNSSMTRGISTRYGGGLVSENKIEIPSGLTNPVGIYHQGTSTSVFDYVDNFVNCSSGLAYSINQTTGMTLRNLYRLGASGAAGNTKNTTTRLAVAPMIASLSVTFNQSSSPTLTINSGGNVIDKLTASEFGIQIDLKGLLATDYIFCQQPVNLTAEGVKSSTDISLTYFYVRTATTGAVVIGIKPASSSGSHVATADIKSGTIRVDILISS